MTLVYGLLLVGCEEEEEVLGKAENAGTAAAEEPPIARRDAVAEALPLCVLLLLVTPLLLS